MKYKVEYTKQSQADLKSLDNSIARIIIKLIDKVSENPLPKNQGGYGEPLGNKADKALAGYCKIKSRKYGVRVVYKLVIENKVMKFVVIAARADDEVYELASART